MAYEMHFTTNKSVAADEKRRGFYRRCCSIVGACGSLGRREIGGASSAKTESLWRVDVARCGDGLCTIPEIGAREKERKHDNF